MSESVSREFAGTAEDVRDARYFVGGVLAGWGLDALSGDVAVIVSELVTNAIVHGHSSCVVSVAHRERGVRVTVEDVRGVAPPVQREPGPTSSTGRGLVLVAALADDWGWQPSARGKIVWAELEMDGVSCGASELQREPS
jgi:anti-sigma regulatory factor (Ser/Thr protein kinase)